ncbi:MAG: DUF1223 domain-containing protein [Pseudomonadota bacterium]
MFASAMADAAADKPVVVELFTSQGDSSCPAADAVLAGLAKQDNVIALTWSVSIWDYAGWRDTLAIPLSNTRHSQYNARAGSAMVYTPQVFIDGQNAHVGSHKTEIEAGIAQQRSDASMQLDIAFSALEPGWVDVRFSAPLPANAQAHVVFYDDVHDVDVSAGENSGRTLRYTNVVRGAMVLDADEKKAAFRVDLSSMFAQNCDAFAILVQDNSSGKIIGAATRRLRLKSS